jgi:hypothetical protein
MKDVLGKIGGFVILVGIVFGLFIVIVAPIEMYRKAQAEHWPARSAVITKSFSDRRGGVTRSTYWKAEICGTYKDGGEFFCVDSIRYGGFRFGAGKQAAEAAVAKYPVGAEVAVYYDPDDPRETVLEARSSWKEMYVLLSLGIGFLLLPFVLWLLRKRLEPERYS